MDKYKDAIRQYEQARQLAAKLEKKRAGLISRCQKVDDCDFHSQICLRQAYEEQQKMCKDNNEYYTFDEVFQEGFYEGRYCKNCYDSYRLKHGDLAKARKAFGIAKRRLSAMGKALI